jgi:hypothetical protein
MQIKKSVCGAKKEDGAGDAPQGKLHRRQKEQTTLYPKSVFLSIPLA